MLNHDKKSNAGQNPCDVVLMFKIILLKRYYNLSDEQAEFSCRARAKQSCFNFAGREKSGQSQIRAGNGDELWNDNPRKKRQKDIDARWTEKGCAKFYGYKDRVKIDSGYKLIDTYEVTSAEVRDSQPTCDLIDEKTEGGQPLYADRACAGKKTDNLLKKRNITPDICGKGYRNYPLTDEQKESNRIKSKPRSRVEHVFDFVTQNMHGFLCRNIDFKRIKGVIGLINLFYNMFRYEQIVRRQLQPVRAK